MGSFKKPKVIEKGMDRLIKLIMELGVLARTPRTGHFQVGITNQLTSAAQEGLALALTINYVNAETVPFLLQQAAQESRSLSLFAAIPTDETTNQILAQAEQSATALAQAVRIKNPDALPN